MGVVSLDLPRLAIMRDPHGYALLYICENLSQSESTPLRAHTIVVWTDIQAASLTTSNRLLNTEHPGSKGWNPFLLENLGCIQSWTGCQNFNAIAASWDI